MSSDIQRHCKFLSHMSTSSGFIIKVKVLILAYAAFSVAVLLIVMEKGKKPFGYYAYQSNVISRESWKVCTTTKSDEWSMIIAGRLAYVNYFPAADAFQCSTVPFFFVLEGGGGGGGGAYAHLTH